MNKLKLKPALPRQVQIIEKSPYEVAQSFQDKCQPLRTHILAKMQSKVNPIQPSQIGYIAKKIDENELMNKIEQNEKKLQESSVQQPLTDRSQKLEDKYYVQPLSVGNGQKLEQQQQTLSIHNGEQNNLNESQTLVEDTNDKKFKRLSRSLHDSSHINKEPRENQVKNIFESAKIYQNFSKDEEVGPKFTKEGKIIPYSVVGKPQWYVKELIKEKEKHKTSQNSECSDQTQKRNNTILNDLIKTKTSSPNNHNRRNSYININENGENTNNEAKMNKTQIYPRLWFQQEDKTFISDVKFMKRKQKQEDIEMQGKEGKELYCEQELTEQQVKQKIQDEEDRIHLNKSRNKGNNIQILQSLTIEEQIALTKESRVLQKFEKNERQFEELVFKQAINLQREPENSILLSGDQHRKKIETINAFEILKPIDKKHGDTYWYKVLRNYPFEQSEQNSKRPEWYPNDKNERLKEENLEIIHKKRSLSMVVKNRKKDTLNGTFTSFKSGYYAQKKLDQTQNEWNYDQVKHIQEENYEQQKSIEAVGVNKFQQEKDSILNYSNEQRLVQFQNLPEGKTNANDSQQQLQNSRIQDRYQDLRRGNSSFVSGNRSRINSASDGVNGQITYKTKFLKKYTLNDEYKNEKFQANGSLILGYPRQEQQSNNGSFIQINSQFLESLKNKNQQSVLNFEEQNIISEEVLHAQWQDRQTLAKTGKFVFKKVQLIH